MSEMNFEDENTRRMNKWNNSFINGELMVKDDEGKIAEFVPLEVDNNFEILSVGPHTIRRKDNHKEVRCNDYFRYMGRSMIILNGKLYPYIDMIDNQFYKTESKKVII